MTVVVQNASGTATNANSYLSEAEFEAYFADRGVDTTDFDEEDVQAALVKATDYLDQRFQFIGSRQNRTQTTQWPRLDAIDSDGWLVSGIPTEVKEATAEYAHIAITQTLNPTPDRDSTGQKVKSKREKIGPIEEGVEYVDQATFTLPKYPVADQRLINAGLVITRRTLKRA